MSTKGTPVSPAVRRRLETQGFVSLDEATLAEIGPWLRFSYALCALFTGLGTALASPLILWGLVPIAALGAIFPVHPFDLIYNYGVRHLTGTRPLPQNGAPKRFACGMGAVWLAVTAWAFGTEMMLLGYVLGSLFTAVATIAAVSYFCLPSTIYCALFGRPTQTH
jgi:hypothetical protein